MSWRGLQQQSMSATYTRPSCVRGSHVCASKHRYCWKNSKCVGVGEWHAKCEYCAKWVLRKSKGFGHDTIAFQSSHTCLVLRTTLCTVSHHTSFLLVNGRCSSVWLRPMAVVCGIKPFHTPSLGFSETPTPVFLSV